MIKQISSQSLARYITAFLFLASLAGAWDAWWHAAVGRDTFFEPPHLLLYSAVSLAIVGGIYGWHTYKQTAWKSLAIVLFFIPLSAPFDNLWHVVFGVEDLTSPLVIWSPPHLVLILSVIGSFAMLLRILKKDRDIAAQRVFGAIAFASMLSMLTLIVAPLEPIGPWHLLDFWGAGFVAFVLVFILLWAQQWIPGFGGGFVTIACYMILFTAGGSETVAPGIDIPPHAHTPKWLTVFSFIFPVALIEYLKHVSIWLQGVVFSLVWSIFIYGFSSRFFEVTFQYSTMDTIRAICMSVLGGLCAGALAQRYTNQRTVD